jgi:hypothetical protein
MTRPIVFISYSSQDEETVKDLVTFLRSLGVEVKIDEEILRPSNPIGETLREQIQCSDACLFVLTENSLKSDCCLLELGAFWGAGKTVIIHNPSGVSYRGLFGDYKQAKNLAEVKRAVRGLDLGTKTFANMTDQEAAKVIEASVKSGLNDFGKVVAQFSDHFPALHRIIEHLDVQSYILGGHAPVLSKVTENLRRGPKKVTWASDVPSFGSISAAEEYCRCRDAFETYIATEEWDITILLLPADVGVQIVNTEFKEIRRQRKAWKEDIEALQRFRRYAQRARERGRRKFNIGWLAMRRGQDGAPSCLHGMPINIWIFDDDEAVVSTVINNYKPTGGNHAGAGPQEIGFSTRNKDMVRFFREIVDKYEQNIDETMTLANQLAASKLARARILRSLPPRSGFERQLA